MRFHVPHKGPGWNSQTLTVHIAQIGWSDECGRTRWTEALGNQFAHWYRDWSLPPTGGEHGCLVWISLSSWWDCALTPKAAWLICRMTLRFHSKRVEFFFKPVLLTMGLERSKAHWRGGMSTQVDAPGAIYYAEQHVMYMTRWTQGKEVGWGGRGGGVTATENTNNSNKYDEIW